MSHLPFDRFEEIPNELIGRRVVYGHTSPGRTVIAVGRYLGWRARQEKLGMVYTLQFEGFEVPQLLPGPWALRRLFLEWDETDGDG